MANMIEQLYDILSADAELTDMLSETPLGDPAIYETWVQRNTSFPALVYTWEFADSTHWARREATLDIHIFDESFSAKTAHSIRDRVVELLDQRHFENDEAGPTVRYYLATDGIMPEEDDRTIHWVVTFRVVFWRKQFIEHLEGDLT